MQQSIDRSGGIGNKGTEAAIWLLKWFQQASLTHQKRNQNFTGPLRQRIAFRVEGIKQ
jgi:hypothetical protein